MRPSSAKKAPVYCAAIDLGATSGRVIVGQWARKRLTLTEVHRFPNRFLSVGGHDYWDLPLIWFEITRGLRQARQQFPSLASVGVDTWGVDHVLTNDKGRMVFPSHAYRDARTQAGLGRLTRTRAALDRIYQATGIPNVFYNTSLQLEETLASCPAVADLATRCLLLPDYFNFLLSGRMENEVSIASTTQLLDAQSPTWSRRSLDHFHIPPGWFTPPVMADTLLGKLSAIPELKDVKVVAVPGHDTACAYDAMPANEDGSDIFISTGTWSLVGYESEVPLLSTEALAARISNERTGDGRYRPLTNVIGLWLLEQTFKDFARRPKTRRDWASLIAKAGRECAPKVLLDVSDPAFANPVSMQEAIDRHLRLRRGKVPNTLAGYARLICDSLGQGHAQACACFERLAGRKFKRILMVGGGAKNPLLCQATADASGLPVWAYQLEGAATGNIGSQLRALGHVGTRPEFRAALRQSLKARRYSPRKGSRLPSHYQTN